MVMVQSGAGGVSSGRLRRYLEYLRLTPRWLARGLRTRTSLDSRSQVICRVASSSALGGKARPDRTRTPCRTQTGNK